MTSWFFANAQEKPARNSKKAEKRKVTLKTVLIVLSTRNPRYQKPFGQIFLACTEDAASGFDLTKLQGIVPSVKTLSNLRFSGVVLVNEWDR
jgi:hypothetical protein